MDKRYAACTIVAKNYVAQARVLVRSFRAEHPDIAFFTLLVDGTEADKAIDGIGTVVLSDELDIIKETLTSMRLIYDVMELSTALKPAMLATIVKKGLDAAAYFDPDIRFYGDVYEVFDSAAEAGIVLTPHTLAPLPRDGATLTERNIMQAGIYNLGFIAVGAQSMSFLDWWHERLTVDAIVDVENALFTDQRWIDWVPALFPHRILRDRGLNAAYWNVHERPITLIRGALHAGADELKFYHFSGYDPQQPWQLSRHFGDRARVKLADFPELKALCDEYRGELVEQGHIESRKQPYGLATLGNGLALLPRLRRMARSVITGQLAVSTQMPDQIAFPGEFTLWLTSAQIGTKSRSLTPAQWSVWSEREDLRNAFPDVLGASNVAFMNWCNSDPETRRWLAELAKLAGSGARARSRPGKAKRKAFGWSVVAYADAELGVGEAGRRAATGVLATGVPVELVGTRLGTLSRATHQPRFDVTDSLNFENVLTCVNADQLPAIADAFGLSSLRGLHAGLWFWELQDFPDSLSGSLTLVHEVWVASEFTQRAIQAKTDRYVRLVNLPIEIPTRPTGFTRRSLGMPEGKFIFLTNFDYLSVPDRKNPFGAIRAYNSAFGPDDGAVLIVKSINGHHHPKERRNLLAAAAGRPDVILMDQYVSTAEMKGMIEVSDCFVSLHRSEGYGLNLADAMAHGTPTIATAYSGNLNFMTDDTSLLVPYDLVEVGRHAAPYDPACLWADPDLSAASQSMRSLFDDRSRGFALAARALEHVSEHHGLIRAAESFRPLVLGLTEEHR